MMNSAVSRKLAINLLWILGAFVCLATPNAAFAMDILSPGYAHAQCIEQRDDFINRNGGTVLTNCQLNIRPESSYSGDYSLLIRHINSMTGNPDEFGFGFYFVLPGPNDASGDSCPICTPTAGESSPLRADPINATVGNKTETVVEYAGSGPFPLTFAWTYNSIGSGIVETPDRTAMGYNRSHTYQRSVKAIAVNASGLAQTWAYVALSNGNSERYIQSGSTWVAGADNANTLISLVDGLSNITGWEHHLASGDVEYYGSDGKLTRITERSGLSQTMGYDTQGRLSVVTDSFGRSLIFAYDTLNEITSVSLPDGRVIGFAYSNGNLATVTHPDLTTTQYLYAESGLVDPNDAIARAAMTGVVDEKSVRYSSTTYDAHHNAINSYLAGGVDRYDFAYQIAAGSTLMPQTTVTGPLGKTEVFTNVATFGTPHVSGLTQNCSGCTSLSQSNTFDANGRLNLRTDFNGITYETDFDANGLLTQVIRAKGTTQQQAETTQWNTALRVPTQIDRAGQRQTYTYNSRGQALTSTLTDTATSATRTSTYTYCESADITAGTCPLLGLITSFNGPRSDVSDITTYTYYPNDAPTCLTAPTTCSYRKGDLWKLTNALGQITTYTAYDGAGRLLSSTDTNGVVTDMTYNTRGWLTQRADRGTDNSVTTDDAITNYVYDATGQVTQVTQPGGAFVGFTYDAAHRLTDISDNYNNTIHYTLDNVGNRTKDDTRDPSAVLKRSVLRVYNQLGQLQASENANAAPNASFTYDANGNTKQITDGLSHVNSNSYDPLNRLSIALQDANSAQVYTNYAYDARDHLTQVTDPQGLATIYQYDGLDNLTRLTSPDTGITNYTVDAAGNRKTQTDARGSSTTATYSYDALNRLTAITYPLSGTLPNQLNVSFTYDVTQTGCAAGNTFGVGRLTQTVNGTTGTGTLITTSLCYDRFGRLAQKIQSIAGQTATTTSYAYDMAGRLTQTTTPLGTVIKYTRDNAGRTTAVKYHLSGQTVDTTVVSNLTYYPYGPVATITYGNGRVLTRSYDQDYVVSGVNDPSAGGLALSFGRDVIGNLTQAQSGATGNNFVYDGLNRLKTVNDLNNALIAAYTYDATSNRLSKQTSAATQLYTYPLASHQLIDVAGTARTYDAAGNTTKIGAQLFGYDASNRLCGTGSTLSGICSDTAAGKYLYDWRGQRVRKIVKSTNTTMFTAYDESGHPMSDYTNPRATNRIREYIWMDDLPVGVLNSGTTAALGYIEPDHLGTPRAVIDPATNAAVWKWPLLNDAFGETQPVVTPDANFLNTFDLSLRFPGQRYDSESGLNYNYFRDYDPSTGRYAESDPIGLGGGITTYGYVDGNPLSYQDARGENPGAVLGGEIGTLVEPGGGTAVGAIVGGLINAGIVYVAAKYFCPNKPNCPPCSPYPAGTVGFARLDTTHTHYPVMGPHLHLRVVRQRPPPDCACFWNDNNPKVASPPPLPNWVDLTKGEPPLTW
jgi:RHS repeat-associated protein